MDNKKNISIMLVCTVLVFLLICGNQKVNAVVGKDVTKTITDKGKMKKLSNEFRDLLGYYTCHTLEINESKLFDFSKKKSRQEAIKFTYGNYGRLSGSAQNKLSKQLFGAGIAKTEQLIGDWGCSYPVLNISKIYKTSARQYQMNVTIYMDDEDGGHEKMGTAAIFLKKDLRAKYGYYVKRIEILK